MTHYIGVVASLAIRRSPASTQPANLLLIPERTNEYAHRLPYQLPGSRGIIYMAVADGLANYGHLELMVRGLRETRVLVESAADARYLSSGHLAFVRRGTLMLMPFDLLGRAPIESVRSLA